MTDETGKENQESAAAAPAGATDTAAAEAAAAGHPAEVLTKENADLKDRVLRTMAEMENLRRRTEREVRDAGQYAIASFARDLLAVADNLRRALDAVGDEARATADPTLTALLEGVEMTERELLKVYEKHGVTRLEPTGQKFDPNFHQAMFEIPDPSVPAGTVAQVMQAGYVIGERVLRPAMVGVARGGPKFVADTPAAADARPAAEPGSTINREA
ncbi:MAG: nucleotide exchange factor GrpE [Hyphomicrobiales bacterium]